MLRLVRLLCRLCRALLTLFLAIGSGAGTWAAAYEQARALVAQMTNEEKQNTTFGNIYQ